MTAACLINIAQPSNSCKPLYPKQRSPKTRIEFRFAKFSGNRRLPERRGLHSNKFRTASCASSAERFFCFTGKSFRTLVRQDISCKAKKCRRMAFHSNTAALHFTADIYFSKPPNLQRFLFSLLRFQPLIHPPSGAVSCKYQRRTQQLIGSNSDPGTA